MSEHILQSIFLAILTLQLCYSIEIQCPRENFSVEIKESPFPTPEKMKFGNKYETTIRFTNWKSNETAKFVERNYNGSIVISKRTLKSELTWIKTADRLIFLEASTTGDHKYFCTGGLSEVPQNIFELSPTLRKFFGGNVFSFGSILNSLVSNPNYQHHMLENSTGITAGVETYPWMGCATNATETGENIQVNVFMTGDLSKLMPYNENFRNPQVMAFHVQVYQDIQLPNSTEYKHNISEHISFDIVTLDLADMAQAQLALTFQPARGKFCSGLPKASIPPQFLGQFLEASLEYVDATEKVVDNIELFYNEPEHLFSMIMDFQADHDLPFLANSSSVTGSARVVHDFGYGLQYTLSRDGRACKGVHPIDSQMGDVHVDGNKTLYLKSLAEMFLYMSSQHDDYYYAGKVVSEEGVVLDAYVTKTAETQDGRTVLEMLYYSDKAQSPLLHSIVQYHENKSGELLKKTVLRLNSLNNHTTMASHLVYPCLQDYNGGNIFFLSLQNATMDDLNKIGMEQVEQGIIQAIAHAANFSVLRLTHFMLTQMDEKLLACFVISEKSSVETPAKTAYLQKELSVNEVHQLLNATINATNQFTMHIPAMDPKQAGLTILSNEFGQLPAMPSPGPPKPPGFVGYSGRAMFVLGFFMFIFGAVLVVGSFLFYSKRQSIRGMAYQVFE